MSDFRRLVAPHSKEANGRSKIVDAALVTCDAMVSLAHDPGTGGSMGEVVPPGASELLWSRDGRDWKSRDLGTMAELGDIAFGANTWVAVGRELYDGGLIVSSEGAAASNWHEAFRSMYPFGGVAYGANAFVAVTMNGVAVSADGLSWHWAQLPNVHSIYYDVAFGADHFVVAGVGAVLSSTDGETWVEASCDTCPPIATPSGSNDYLALQEVHYGGDAFYGFGASGDLASRDGIEFAPVTRKPVPDTAIGDTLLSGSHISTDAGMSWTPLGTGADVTSADCTVSLCVAAEGGLLAFNLGGESTAAKK